MTNEYNDAENRPGEYHYTPASGLPRDDYRSYYAPASPEVNPPRKERKGLRVAALLLAAAVVAAVCGYGGAALYGAGGRTGKTAVQQSSREAVQVSVKRVDGQTLMTAPEVYAAAVNSVVSINCSATATNVFGQRVESASSGSGFIISADGYIVTNYHVISGATSISVTLYNGDTYSATLVGGDSDYDTAVLKVDATGLTAVTLGSSTDLNVGDTVLAIGNPLGELTFSMSQGIVSCLDRAINVDGTPFNMIQVDCSINPGNSGGPLLNLYGEVVGIVSAKYSSYSSTTVEGLGFALPMDDVQTVITDIMENGEVSDKAYMAINAGTMTESMAAQYGIDVTEGVFVFSAVKGGAGEKAGLKLGDVITKLGDTAITSMEDLSMAKKSYKAGDTATLTVYREGEYITLDITFDAQPQVTGSAESETPSGGNQQVPDNWEDFYNFFFGNRGW
ncbi:MAG: trypsin-like peptidase domain-containing protein [Oscillospiraceae bacterium]|nr:trypsin-like peptidase domain-containing protein [Oscillospiraceae bacterium]